MPDYIIKRSIGDDESNARTYASIQEMMDLFIEVAVSHVDSEPDIFGEDKVWMIYRWQIHHFNPPQVGTKLEVRTTVVSADRLFFYRYFDAIDEEGNVVATAMSQWVIVDAVKRRIKPVPKSSRGIFDETADTKTIQKLEKIIPHGSEVTLKTQTQDVDSNGHINNVIYVDYIERAMQQVETEFIKTHYISEMDVIYAKEILHPSEIVVVMESASKLEFNYMIVSKDKTETHCFIRAKYAELLD